MNRERIKSVVLLSLVILSFILATRLWFNISIEGIFIMFQNKDKEAAGIVSQYDKSNLMRPDKLIVNMGERHVLLTKNSQSAEIYSQIFDDSKALLKALLSSGQTAAAQKIPMGEIGTLRSGRNIEMHFNFGMRTDVFAHLLGVDKNPWEGIEQIDGVILSAADNNIYIQDSSQHLYFRFKGGSEKVNLEYAISEVEKSGASAYMFFNEIKPELYGANVIVPAEMGTVKMPILAAEKENGNDSKMKDQIIKFFDGDTSAVSIIKDPDDTVIYTDREQESVRIDTSGMLEYVRYNVSAPEGDADLKSALEVSTDFINKHLGFPYDTYITGIEPISQVNRTIGYLIKYKYRYEGLPVLLDSDDDSSAIEIEVVGDAVRRYKRQVYSLHPTTEMKTIQNPVNILDILLTEDVKLFSGERIACVNDMYPAYFERNDVIPVWVVDVTVEKTNRGVPIKENKQYIIGAESGVILDRK